MRRIIVLLLVLLTLSNPLPPVINTALAISKIFLPIIAKPIINLGMGIAWQEISESGSILNADWTYNDWRYCSGDCIKSFPWANPTECDSTFLIFNEPEWTGDAQFTPQQAAEKSRQVRTQCPSSTIIAGNVTQFGREWLQEYVSLGGVGDWLGFHCYVWEGRPAQDCIDLILEFQNAFPNHNLCLTEWNIIVHHPILLSDRYQFGVLMQYIKNNLQCSAVFTDYWFADTTGKLNLLNVDRTPNEIGAIYANRNEGAK